MFCTLLTENVAEIIYPVRLKKKSLISGLRPKKGGKVLRPVG
jgi:hypothetical protein